MSVIMVQDETINRVVEWLFCEVKRSTYLENQLGQKLSEAVGIDITHDQWCAELGQVMFELNIAGVNARYGEGEASRIRKSNYTYTPVHSSKIQVFKLLECLLYQCMEGGVVKKPLYRFLREVVEPHLMGDIICDLPEYTRAVWG